MQLAPGADAVGLAALASHLVDIALDQQRSLESNLQRPFQVLQKTAQGLAQATKAVKVLLLHLIKYNCIQIYISQEKNR